MNILLIFLAGLGIGGLVVYFFVVKQNKKHSNIQLNVRMLERERAESLIERQAEEKRRNLEAIMGLLESGNGPLTNDHVEKMLGISDATAERYLQELEKQGRVRQVGKTGKYVYYDKI